MLYDMTRSIWILLTETCAKYAPYGTEKMTRSAAVLPLINKKKKLRGGCINSHSLVHWHNPSTSPSSKVFYDLSVCQSHQKSTAQMDIQRQKSTAQMDIHRQKSTAQMSIQRQKRTNGWIGQLVRQFEHSHCGYFDGGAEPTTPLVKTVGSTSADLLEGVEACLLLKLQAIVLLQALRCLIGPGPTGELIFRQSTLTVRIKI